MPSIVYGIIGLTAFVGMFGLFGTPAAPAFTLGTPDDWYYVQLPFGRSVLAGGLSLMLVVLPIVIISAQEALQGRLVRSVHAPDELLPAAHALAREIADHTSAVSVALTRQLLWRMLGESHPMDAHRLDSRGILALGRSADAREGVAAFLEKRAARFSARPTRDMPDFYPWWTEPEFE